MLNVEQGNYHPLFRLYKQ